MLTTILFSIAGGALLARAVRWRDGVAGRNLVAAAVSATLLLYACSTRLVAFGLERSLERHAVRLALIPPDTEAMVVLGGSVRLPDAARLEPELGEDSLYRLLAAVDLHRAAPDLRIIVCGGKDPESTSPLSLADVMADFLVKAGIPAAMIVRDVSSESTHENALRAADLLHDHGLRRIVLVTDYVHMTRAAAAFRKRGILVVPAPCHLRATVFHFAADDLVPRGTFLAASDRVAHEWVGMAYYWVRGWI